MPGFIITALGWFTGSKIGRYVALFGGLALGALTIFLKGSASGFKRAQAKIARKASKDAHTVQTERTKAEMMSDAEVDKEFDKWTKH